MKLPFNETLKSWIRRMSWDASSESLRRRRIRSGTFSALEFLEHRQLLTQTISMVSDINAVSTDFRPENFILVGNTTFFTATTPDSGTELWKTDGTSAGTVLVKDIWPGKVSSVPKSLTNVNGTLYFSATTPENGNELWKSNGTVDGTRLVADIFAETSSSSPQQLVNFQGSLFFSANNGSEGRELWTTKGMTNGATRFAGIPRGTASNPDKLTVVESTLYFVAEERTTGTELWKTNGVSGSRVRDIRSGTPSSMPDLLTNVAGKLYFVADNGTAGRQIWTTNGTDTSPVTGTQPGLSRPSPQQLTAVGTRLFFTAEGTSNGTSVGRELWKTDGTSASTSLVRDIRQGGNSSSPNSLVNVNGQLYFSANNGVTGTELWKTNGSTLATAPIADIRANGDSNPQSLTDVNGTLFFAADDGSIATKLWKVNSSGGTQVVKTIVTRKDSLRSLTNINGVLYFSAPGATSGSSTNSSEFWRSNGTDPGTTRVRNASGGSNPGAFIRGGLIGGDPPFFVDEYVHANVNGILYFVANDGVRGNELWKTDGTAAGTKLVLDINQVSTDLQKTTRDADPRELTNVGGKLYFTAYNGASSGSRSLWVIDSATSIPRRVEPSAGQTMNDPVELVSFGGKLFFSARGLSPQGRELWQSDGTTTGTKMVKDLNPGASSSSPMYMTVAGNTLFFRADGGNGFTLWKSNGTPSGTVPVVSDRILNPMLLTAGGTKIYFLSNRQLWVSDGFNSGTAQLTNNDVSESGMAYMDGFLYFHGSDQNGFELWKTNGTHDGTKMVKDINPLQGHSFIAEMTVVNHTLFFRAGKLGDGSEELWKSDGTTNGTQQVLDIRPGNASSYPQQLLNGNGILYFVANDGTHGGELWRSDGTASGTSMIKDFIPGPGAPGKYESGSNRPRILTNIGSKIFFSATDGVSGHELYSLSGTVAVAPVLTSPGATTTSQVPRFQWNSVTGAVSYDLWFQNLSTGIITQRTGLTTTSYTPPAALGIGRYVVQLRTKISNNEFSPWSPRFEFRINTSVKLTSMSPQQTTARPKVAWTALPGAVKYDLWLDNTSTGQSQFVRKVDITSTTWTHTSNLPAGRYQVWVRGIDKAGIAALWSTPIDFEVVLQSASSVATTGKSGPVLAHAEAMFPLSLPESESFSYRTELPLGSEWAEIDEVMASLWE